MGHYSFYWLSNYNSLPDDIGEEYLTDDIDKEWMRQKGLRIADIQRFEDGDNGQLIPIWIAPTGWVYYYEDLKRLKDKKTKAPPTNPTNPWDKYTKPIATSPAANPMPVLNSFELVTQTGLPEQSLWVDTAQTHLDYEESETDPVEDFLYSNLYGKLYDPFKLLKSYNKFNRADDTWEDSLLFSKNKASIAQKEAEKEKARDEMHDTEIGALIAFALPRAAWWFCIVLKKVYT